ncbi:MAG TPA: hypothetical protein VMV92_12625 [Streptosporangiaceae bacterium]|nr:hypothetical protein [Streptosporangiaceae bacterium]
MPVVQFPPGCSSLRFADGLPPAKANRPGGYSNVSDERAKAINSMSGNGTAGLVNGNPGTFVTSARKNGRWCKACSPARLWNAWSALCPRCGSPTEPE